MSLEKSPDRGVIAWNSLLAHRRNDLVQGQIQLLGDQSQQPFHVLFQRRRAPAAQLCSGDVEASLSTKDISDILGSILIDDPSNTLQFISLTGIARRLIEVGRLGNLQPPTPVSPPLSLRAAIAAAVSQLTLLPQPVPQL